MSFGSFIHHLEKKAKGVVKGIKHGFRSASGVVKSGISAAKHTVSQIYKDGKRAVSTVEQQGFALAQDTINLPATIAQSVGGAASNVLSGPFGLGLAVVAGIVGISFLRNP